MSQNGEPTGQLLSRLILYARLYRTKARAPDKTCTADTTENRAPMASMVVYHKKIDTTAILLCYYRNRVSDVILISRQLMQYVSLSRP